MENNLFQKALLLLKSLIETQSYSGEEDHTAQLIANWFSANNIVYKRSKNNVWATNKYYDEHKPSILLNSHHDTVKPNKGYTNDPFNAFVENGKLFGLGSNDAGGCLTSLMVVFYHYYQQKNLNYNLILAATAEEENSGKNGLHGLIKELPTFDFAVVGEPTDMNMAIAEKGLLVIDGYAKGISGHAAHDNTQNAIYEAMKDVEWINNYSFPNQSELLGEVKMSVTQISAGHQHNVVPAECHFVIDIRVNDCYSNETIFKIINSNTKSRLEARSFLLNSSSIAPDHPFVMAGKELNLSTYGSPTLSDQSAINCPSLKMGPGSSLRSHSADEFIYLHELEEGIELYINLFNKIL